MKIRKLRTKKFYNIGPWCHDTQNDGNNHNEAQNNDTLYSKTQH